MIFCICNDSGPKAVIIRELVVGIVADCPMIDLITSGRIADGNRNLKLQHEPIYETKRYSVVVTSFLNIASKEELQTF